MIKVLILFFLNIKPTHGYNIQRFIEVNDLNLWAKVQSGSIYYALNKMETSKLIYTLREEKTGARIRKVFAITDLGKQKLKEFLLVELEKPIMEIESEKFMIYIMLNILDKDEIITAIEKLNNNLREKKTWWEKGKQIKIKGKNLDFEILNFDMVISNLNYQILWHTKLVEEIDEILDMSDKVSDMIRQIDFSENENKQIDINVQIAKLKSEILSNPDEGLDEKINKLVNLLRNKED